MGLRRPAYDKQSDGANAERCYDYDIILIRIFCPRGEKASTVQLFTEGNP